MSRNYNNTLSFFVLNMDDDIALPTCPALHVTYDDVHVFKFHKKILMPHKMAKKSHNSSM